jgi:hypothetical protein
VHDTNPCSFESVGSVEVYHPMIRWLVDASMTCISPLHNEVHECLILDRPSRDEFNIILADLHCPLCNLPHCFFALKDAQQWLIGYDSNDMGQEVVLEFPVCHKDCIEKLMNLWVPCSNVLQDLADKVHMLLFKFCRGFRPFNGDDCADNGVGSCNI